MAAEGIKLGGLKSQLLQLSQRGAERCQSSVEVPRRAVVCPTPRLPNFPRGYSSGSLTEEEAVASRCSNSRNDTELEDSVTELRRILEVDCTLDPDPVSFLGVSPPLRSGAANPLCQDSAWKLKAQQASRSSLEPLLQSIERTRCSAAASQCRGDYQVLFSPAEYSSGLLTCDTTETHNGAQHRGPRRLVPMPHSWRTASLSPA